MSSEYTSSTPLALPRRAILVVHICIVAGMLAGFLLQSLLLIPAESLVYPLCVFSLGLFLWSIWSWSALTKSLFDPYVLLLIATGSFTSGQAFLEVFHLNSTGLLFNRFPAEILAQTLFLVCLGLASLHLGALLSASFPPREAAGTAPSTTPSLMDARIAGWILLTISAPFALLELTQAVRTVVISGYFAIYQQNYGTGLAAGPRVIADFLIPGALLLFATSRGSRVSFVTATAAISLYSFASLFIGYRHTGVLALVICAWLWHRCIRPLPKSVLISGAAISLFVLIPLVGVVRNTPGQNRLSPGYWVQSYTQLHNPLVIGVSEMGESMQTVAYAVELVPSTRDYDKGVGYLYGLSTVFPNILWDVHPADAHSYSRWLVRTVAPIEARLGGGLGFTLDAEAYLNFSWMGIVLVLGGVGFFYARFVLWGLRSNDYVRLGLLATVAYGFTFAPRSESSAIVRWLVWYCVLPYLLILVVAQLRRSGVSGRITAPPDRQRDLSAAADSEVPRRLSDLPREVTR